MSTVTQTLIRSDAHWYRQDGTAMHTVTKKDGGERPVNLGDARKHKLCPSVTSVQKILANPGLETWKQVTYGEALLTGERNEGESLQDYAKRMAREFMDHTDQYAQLGKDFEACVHAWHDGKGRPEDKRLDAMLGAYLEFMEREKLTAVDRNVRVIGDGYAGTIDIVFEHPLIGVVVADIKTQKGDRITFYDSWPIQLAAYSRAYARQHKQEWKSPANVPYIMSLAFSTWRPGELVHKLWTADEQKKAWTSFRHQLRLWELTKGYSARGKAV